MAEKDITTKTILKHIVKDIAHYIFHLDLDSADFIETEYQRVEKRHADLVVQAKQAERNFILHIEIQNDNQSIMPLRMMRYYTDIALSYPRITDIEQYLIYIGKNTLTMPDGINNKNHQYHYHVVDMRTIDCAVFLNESNPHAVVLAVLCDFKGKDKREVIRQLLMQIDRLTLNNSGQYNDCLLALEILSENRDLKEVVKEEEKMLSEIKLENLPSYEIGLERGEARGKAKGEAKGEARERETIVQRMLSDYNDNEIHKITGIELTVILAIKAKRH